MPEAVCPSVEREEESQVWTVLYHAPVKASYRYRGDVQIVADCVIMSPSGVVRVVV